MIKFTKNLFERRILYKDGKMYDLQTSNKSFIDVANKLKKSGIENWYFMLEIKDKRVLSIDPYDDRLSKRKIDIIENECRSNPWYFIREIFRVRGVEGKSHPFYAHRGNIAQLWCILNDIDSHLVLERAKGKTTSNVAFMTWLFLFGSCVGINVSYNRLKSKYFIRRIDDAISLTPTYIHEDIRIKSKDNTIYNISNNSEIYSSGPELDARYCKIKYNGRIGYVFVDDSEYVRGMPTTLSELDTCLRISTSVPGDIDTKTGRDALAFINNTIRWTEKMYDWGSGKTKKYIQTKMKYNPNKNGVLCIEYNGYELDDIDIDDWIDEIDNVATKFGHNNEFVKREFLLDRT